jgi:hypothetical protein
MMMRTTDMQPDWMMGLMMGLLLVSGCAYCDSSGTGQPEPPGAAPAGDATGQRSASFVGFEAPVPGSWLAQKPVSSMRVVQYQVPAAPGAEPAELVAYYFGPGQGGSVENNIARWRSQFSTPEGGAVEPLVKHLRAGALPVTTAEFRGSYARGMGMGPAGTPRPDQTLLAAIVETPKGAIIIQLHGPTATVAANRDAYMAFVLGIRAAGK